MDDALKNKSILLFDGYCHLCQSSVQFILRHEKKPELYFASLQSEIGCQLLNQYSIDPTKVDSLVLIEHNNVFLKSSAALRLTKYLKGMYSISFGLMVIPEFIRNVVYDFIAKNRYKWFGKATNCMVPSKDLMNRFL